MDTHVTGGVYLAMCMCDAVEEEGRERKRALSCVRGACVVLVLVVLVVVVLVESLLRVELPAASCRPHLPSSLT